jgi:ubiquinone/menaquinone biosynthesis C-methylase UbiE
MAERAFLRTCCYYPPRPKRKAGVEVTSSVASYSQKYERAFGRELWSLIEKKKVLDLGCGEGGYVLALASKGAGSTVGLDIQANFSAAQEASRQHGYRNVRFIHGTTAAIRDQSFDVTISHDSFEHFPNPEDMLTEMSRVTKENGNLLIKFGPPWRNPWGRHMSGTVRRDRPWIHLVVPEKTIMRCHSVYHDESVLKERFDQLPGGLNKMTLGRFKKILKSTRNVSVRTLKVSLVFSPLPRLGIVQELFASEVSAHCVRVS